MKIIHIVSNKEWGGGEQYVYDLCQRQRADGIDVSVCCKPVDAIRSKYEEAGMSVNAMPLGGALDAKSAWQLAAVVRQAGACTIHAHNFKDAFTACYARRLSGCGRQVRVVMCRHLTRRGKNSILYRWLYRQLDCLVFDSELSKTVFLSTQPAIDQQKLRVVHTSVVVPQHVEPAPLRQELGIPADSVLAVYHGRLDQEKGLDTLVQAVARIKERPFHLVLVGRGSDEYTAHLMQLIAADGLQQRVMLAGFRHPVIPYVAAADFGILASTVSEGCPLSPQEYMSQGRPVIVTDNGGQREYVIDGHNGLLVPPGDIDALAKAMARMTDDDDLRWRLGQQAKADFDDHLNYEHFYSQITEIYK